MYRLVQLAASQQHFCSLFHEANRLHPAWVHSKQACSLPLADQRQPDIRQTVTKQRLTVWTQLYCDAARYGCSNIVKVGFDIQDLLNPTLCQDERWYCPFYFIQGCGVLSSKGKVTSFQWDKAADGCCPQAHQELSSVIQPPHPFGAFSHISRTNQVHCDDRPRASAVRSAHPTEQQRMPHGSGATFPARSKYESCRCLHSALYYKQQYVIYSM